MTTPYREKWVSDCGTVTLYLGDCLEVLPTLEAGSMDAVVTDPPYGMKKAAWDREIPNWLPLCPRVPTACFCGVVGMKDYPPADWVGAWVRIGSTQRNGRLRGFNNWEPILFYGVRSLANDVISMPNDGGTTQHPTEKPERLMSRLITLVGGDVVCDPFMGSGTTGVACVRLGRRFIGIELESKYFAIAKRRIIDELNRVKFLEPPKRDRQKQLIETE